jgi:hypothetical protein
MNITRKVAGRRAPALLLTISGTILGAIPGGAALADVTVQEQTTIHAMIVKAHATSTDRISADKQRKETEFSCDGMMSMLCGHNKSVDIVRLDRDLSWKMEPKQKRYTEFPFPTSEQQRAARAHQQAVIDKLKSCPAAQPAQSSLDTSKCEMAPPVFTENKTAEVTSIIGHQAQRTNVAMTQSCKMKDTADTCKLVYSLDVWLTAEELPGLADRKSFQSSYMRKMGLTGAASTNPADLNPMLAPYAENLKKLAAKSADFEGYPLKTTFRFSVGGEHCALAPTGTSSGGSDGTLSNAGKAAGDATASSTQHAAGWGTSEVTSEAVQHATGGGGIGGSVGGYVAGSAAGAFAQNLVGGLFAKKKKADPAPSASQPGTGAPADAAGGSTKMVAEITVETIAIDPAPIAADQFEVPPTWKKLTPKADTDEAVPSCPST